MKRKIFLAMWVLTATLGLQAQRWLVTGAVQDDKTKQAMQLVSVVLLKTDSTVVRGTSTDENGRFRVKAPQAGNYILKTSFMGYGTQYKNIQLSAAKDSIGLGWLNMKTDDQLLKEAVVTATVARVEQKEDTTMFNAAAYRTPQGSTLEALIKQLPGVEVDDNGTIKVHGKEVKELLINGKDFFKGDNDVAMKNLPVEMVNRIKAYDKASDYTEQTGIDDGQETTVLDIMTKRELNESWVSNLDLAYGTEDRYSAKFFVTRFTDRTRVTAYGSLNNVNDMGFGSYRGWGGGGGLTARKDAGMDFQWENNKDKKEAGRLELGGNVRYTHTSTDAVSTTASENFLGSTGRSSFSNSRNVNGSSSTRVNSSFRLQWKPDTMTTITFRPSFNHSSSYNAGSNSTGTFNDDPYAIEGMENPLDSILLSLDRINPALSAIAVNRNQRFSKGESNSNNVNGTLNFTRKFNSLGRNVSLRLSGGYGKSKSESFSISDIHYFNGDAPRFLNQYSNTPSENWNYSVRLSYAEPITKNLFAEVRYDYSYRYTDSDRSRYNLDSLFYAPYADTWPQYAHYGNPEAYPMIGSVPTEDDVLNAIRDLNNSQYATYKYYDHTANVGLRYNTEKIRFNAGVDFNPERTKMAYERPGQNIDTVIVRKVFNVSPQLRFRYRFSKTNNLDIRYRGSSSQPSMTNLLAVVDNADPLNVSMGNPGLKPSWTNSFNAFYRGYNAEKQQGIMGGVNFSQTNNSVSNMVVYDEATGVRYTRPENINGNWDARGHFMFNTGLGKEKNFTIHTFTNLGYSNNVGYVRTVDGNGARPSAPIRVASAANDYYDAIFNNANVQKNKTKNLSVGERLNLTYRKTWFDVSATGSVNYQHARATLQENANMDTWNFSYGANANFNFDWGMSFSTDIRMQSRRGYSDANMNTNELLWNAQISQSFLKNRNATISVQFYDILQKQSNVSRVINAHMRSDSWNNAIHSYVMVHFIYKLNIFGGSSKDQKVKDAQKGPGPGGMRPPMMMHRHF